MASTHPIRPWRRDLVRIAGTAENPTTIVVLERLAPGQFRPVAAPPSWFAAFFCADGNVARRSVFLGNFLISAENFWATAHAGRAGSGWWTEVNIAAEEQQFEAFACCAADRKLLIVHRLLALEYRQRQRLGQSALGAL